MEQFQKDSSEQLARWASSMIFQLRGSYAKQTEQRSITCLFEKWGLMGPSLFHWRMSVAYVVMEFLRNYEDSEVNSIGGIQYRHIPEQWFMLDSFLAVEVGST